MDSANRIAVRVNEWIGASQDVDNELIYDLAWAFAMDMEGHAEFNTLVQSIRLDNRTEREAIEENDAFEAYLASED